VTSFIAAPAKDNNQAIITASKVVCFGPIHKPSLESKAKIKKLTQPALSAYRLRVGEYRVFYDADEVAKEVDIIRILEKPRAISVFTGAP
jgi:mRNA-degrading endonuclease RelE of RelBE toxin-antitoxin system